MTVLVTGGTGFVGANIVRYLAAEGYDVVCADRHADESAAVYRRFFTPFENKVVPRTVDITNRDELDDLVARYRPGKVVHAAAITPTREIESSRAEEVLNVNVMGTLHVLEAVRHGGVGRLVYISSAAVYGDSDEAVPITEDASVNPKGLYGISKETSERLCLTYNEAYGTDTVAVRVGWVYGPMERPTPGSSWDMSLVYHFVQLALAAQEIRVAHLDHIRDWIYSHDLAQAVCCLLEQHELPSRCYNLSGGRGYSHRDLLAALNSVVPVRFCDTADGVRPTVPSHYTRGRRGPTIINRILSETRYRPRVDLVHGLRLYVRWVRCEQGHTAT